MSWTAAFRGMHSGLTQQEGSRNRSEAFSTSFGWRRYAVTANYMQTTGASVLTPSGLLEPDPLVGLISDDLMLFNGHSYGFSLSAALRRNLLITANYTSVNSDTLARSLFSLNRGERYNARLEYKLRKISLRAGYSRTWQGIGGSGALPSVINSYYFGLSRWLEIF
jgi:hypothetical protein